MPDKSVFASDTKADVSADEKPDPRDVASTHVGGNEGPVDQDVVNPFTGQKGDSNAGDVGFVNKNGDLDGSAAPKPVKPEDLKHGDKYKAKLGFTYCSKGGDNSPPVKVLHGDTIDVNDISPGDVKVFLSLGYIEAA